MPRAGLTHDRVVAEAEAFADEVGLSQVTISALAARLGVRQPSLYKHIDGMDALQRSISIRALNELTDVLARAAVGRSRGDALTAMSHKYREWAKQHPGRYAACQHAPIPGDAEDQAAANRLIGVCLDVLAGYGLDADDAIDALRALRAALHGFVTLETLGGFGLPVDVDRSFDRMITAIISSLSSQWTSRPADQLTATRRQR
jgi:AcrR family transcriptional regulator